jgi:uncharacterized membrane protein YhhN
MMPFEGGMESPQNATLIFSAAAAIIYATIVNARPGLARSAVKTLAVALLAVLAAMQGAPLLLVAALALSAMGDWFLSRDGERAFLAGLFAFLAAHVAYAALFVMSGDVGTLGTTPWRSVLAGLTILHAVVMLVLLWPRVGPAMRLPVVAYGAGIAGMAISAATLPTPLVVIGAVLFVISDTLLALGRFVLSAMSPLRAPVGLAVWVSYYLAELLITLGFIVI